jgi:arsenate reductase
MSNSHTDQITVYGLKSCDTCRKAQKWLQSLQLDFRFHDLRADGLDEEMLGHWLGSDFSSKLLNQRSTTWRQLTEAEKASSATDLKSLLRHHPALIKRPVFTRGNRVLAVGFKPAELETVLNS